MPTKTKKRAALTRKSARKGDTTDVHRLLGGHFKVVTGGDQGSIALTPKGETEVRLPGVPRFTASRDRIVVDQLKLKAADFNEWLEEAKSDGLTITDQAGNAVQSVQIGDCVRRY